ncbi:MAG: carboxypeptidase regulatory-like domain-containing protein [Chitinispirillaceae bacterium]|nr:carboxypeptidase regulatory-like domain-containing protein [Chitinispirillaceae bacterium]
MMKNNRLAVRWGLMPLMACAAALLLHCSLDRLNGGSGAETGNPKITGHIVTACGTPAAGALVYLFPARYNPVVDPPPPYQYIDTTDAAGKYCFTVPHAGGYTVVAEQPGGGTVAIGEIPVDSAYVTVGVAALAKSGAIEVIFPDQTGLQSGVLYLAGTSIVAPFDSSHFSSRSVLMQPVPHGEFPALCFYNSASGTASTIAQGVTVTAGATTVVVVCACSETGAGYDPWPPVPSSTPSLADPSTSRYAWAGSRVAVLTKRPDLDPCVIRRMLTVLDSAYRYTAAVMAATPPIDRSFAGLLPVEEVSSTLFEGEIGATGIEIGSAHFETLYDQVKTQNSFSQQLFFVLASNFNLYLDRFTHADNTRYRKAARRGFCVFMRFCIVEETGVTAAPYMDLAIDDYRAVLDGILDEYAGDTTLTFSTTLARDTVPFPGLQSEHLYAAMLLRLAKTYGTSFTENVWKCMAKRPVAASTQQAVDNWVLACCSAARANLAPLFSAWKIPVSSSALAEAALFPLPDHLAGATPPVGRSP